MTRIMRRRKSVIKVLGAMFTLDSTVPFDRGDLIVQVPTGVGTPGGQIRRVHSWRNLEGLDMSPWHWHGLLQGGLAVVLRDITLPGDGSSYRLWAFRETLPARESLIQDLESSGVLQATFVYNPIGERAPEKPEKPGKAAKAGKGAKGAKGARASKAASPVGPAGPVALGLVREDWVALDWRERWSGSLMKGSMTAASEGDLANALSRGEAAFAIAGDPTVELYALLARLYQAAGRPERAAGIRVSGALAYGEDFRLAIAVAEEEVDLGPLAGVRAPDTPTHSVVGPACELPHERFNIREAERILCEEALAVGGSVVAAADLLGLTRHAMQRRIVKHGIDWVRFPRRRA